MCESDRLFGKRFKSPSLIHMSNGILGQSSKSPSLTHASEKYIISPSINTWNGLFRIMFKKSITYIWQFGLFGKILKSPSLTHGSDGLFRRKFKKSIWHIIKLKEKLNRTQWKTWAYWKSGTLCKAWHSSLRDRHL